jgi:transcriptional regulator with XRE-family HTH domain
MTRAMGVTAGQLRAARALVGWSQHDLARVAGVGRRTIADFERGTRDPLTSTLNQMVAGLMLAGIRFVDDGERGTDGEPEGRGVRWRRPGGEGPNPEALEMFKLFTEGRRQKGEDATGQPSSPSPTADHPDE